MSLRCFGGGASWCLWCFLLVLWEFGPLGLVEIFQSNLLNLSTSDVHWVLQHLRLSMFIATVQTNTCDVQRWLKVWTFAVDPVILELIDSLIRKKLLMSPKDLNTVYGFFSCLGKVLTQPFRQRTHLVLKLWRPTRNNRLNPVCFTFLKSWNPSWSRDPGVMSLKPGTFHTTYVSFHKIIRYINHLNSNLWQMGGLSNGRELF